MRSFTPSSAEQPRRGELAIVARPRPGVEESQDRARVWELDDGRLVMAVADGAGGHAHGARAADTAVDAVGSALSAFDGDDLRSPVLDAFERANRQVLDLGMGAATTLVVAIVEELTVRTLHAGDSVGLVVGSRGAVRLITQAHSPVGYAVEAGVIDREDALHHDELHVVSNMLGADDMRVDVQSRCRMRRLDTVLLASDGLHDNLHLDEIVSLIRRGPIARVARNLEERCAARMAGDEPEQPSKPDDLSFVLFRPTTRMS